MKHFEDIGLQIDPPAYMDVKTGKNHKKQAHRDSREGFYDFAKDKVDIIDNRAMDIACYHVGYTFVEKLQAISTKYRKHDEESTLPSNFMRHYYDIYCFATFLHLVFLGIPTLS